MFAKNILPKYPLFINRYLSTQVNVSKKSSLKPFSAIPGPKTIPLLGNSWNIFPFIGKYDGSDLSVYKKLNDEFGDIIRLEGPFRTNVLVFSHQLIREVFVKAGNQPHRPGLEALLKHRRKRSEVYSNTGLLTEQGEGWKDLRSKVQKHMLKTDVVQSYASPMSEVANDFLERLKHLRNSNMEIDDFLNEVLKWGLESIGVVSLSRRLGCLEDGLSKDSEPQQLIDCTLASFETLHRLEHAVGLWRLISTPTHRKLIEAQTYFEKIIAKYLLEKVEDLKRENSIDTNNILNALLIEYNMNLKAVTAVMMDTFLAGIDTTSLTSSFLMYELAINPDKQEKVYQEMCQVIPDKNALVTSEQLNKLVFMYACIKESMRLHPVTVGTGRKINHDIELGGYEIPANTDLGQMHIVNCRSERYFTTPDKFLPERWLKSEVGRENLPEQFAFAPFGFGARACVGARIAEQEIRILISKILHNFRLEYHEEPIGQRSGIILAANKPFRIKFYDRHI